MIFKQGHWEVIKHHQVKYAFLYNEILMKENQHGEFAKFQGIMLFCQIFQFGYKVLINILALWKKKRVSKSDIKVVCFPSSS